MNKTLGLAYFDVQNLDIFLGLLALLSDPYVLNLVYHI